MGSLLVFNWNCFKLVSLIGKFNSTKWTWWIKLISVNLGSELLKWDLLRASETSMSLLGKYWSSKWYFSRHKKKFKIPGGQEIIDLLKIDFNGLWSLITMNLWSHKYSWRCLTPRIYREFSFLWVMFFKVSCSFQWIANRMPLFLNYGSITLFKKSA